MRMSKKRWLNAVHSVDLVDFLVNTGAYGDYQQGILGCDSCEEPVSDRQLFAAFASDGQAHFICSDPKCVRSFLARVDPVGLFAAD